MHFYGLCAICNVRQSKYDSAYAELSDIVRPRWIKTSGMIPGVLYRPPAATCQPGAVTRSLVIGMFGLNPHLRVLYPAVAAALVNQDDEITLPDDIALWLATARGKRARLSGSIGGFEMFGRRLFDKPLGIMTLAQVYFPPLAWQLAPRETSLLHVQRWTDVSHWLQLPANEHLPLDAICGLLPIVLHPKHEPETGDLWCEMLSDEITSVIECDDVTVAR